MTNSIRSVKRKLDEAITQLCEVSWMFSKHPDRDFTRTRKLPFRKVISFLLSMEGGSLTTEMMSHFGYSTDTASSSAFVQQRSKINSAALPSLFDLFVKKTDSNNLYKGLPMALTSRYQPTPTIRIPTFLASTVRLHIISSIWMQCTICFDTPIQMPFWLDSEKLMSEILFVP